MSTYYIYMWVCVCVCMHCVCMYTRRSYFSSCKKIYIKVHIKQGGSLMKKKNNNRISHSRYLKFDYIISEFFLIKQRYRFKRTQTHKGSLVVPLIRRSRRRFIINFCNGSLLGISPSVLSTKWRASVYAIRQR